jgi:hypothetical protein
MLIIPAFVLFFGSFELAVFVRLLAFRGLRQVAGPAAAGDVGEVL